MAVRFKFRSSAAFNSIDLGGGASISVCDLRAKIQDQTNLHFCDDFDLLISDAQSDRPFDDDEFLIPAGSDVIIKRVPAIRSAPSNLHGGVFGGLVASPSQNVDVENFDDFGNDLYPAFETLLPESAAAVANLESNLENIIVADPRFSDISISRYQNIEGSDLCEAMSKEIVGENCNSACDFQEDKKYKMKSKNEEYPKLDECITKCSTVTPHMDLPTELRCFLCNMIFKDAVMIPCCQHSFCDKCIRSVLIELGRCPKCSSSKCTVKDLLPNLSLRQAIEHFLEAHAAIDGSHIFMPPDGESGIQAKEASCAISIQQQKESEVPDSPSATGKGSNQVMAEYACENKRAGGICIRLDSDKFVKMASSLPKMKRTNLMNRHGENSSTEAFNDVDDIQGGGSSSMLHRNLPTKEEAYFPIQKKKGLTSNTQDGTGGFMLAMKNRKGDRNCYMCGSPNHLIRDCPLSANTYSGDVAFPGGISAYGPPYWHGSSFSHIRPYADMFGAPGVVPFDPRIIPVTPFAVPPYGPSLYPGVTTPYGFMRMGGLSSPVLAAAQRPLSHARFMDLQGGQRKYVGREVDYNNSSEDYHYDETQRRSHERKHQSDKETLRSCSDDGNQRIHKKHQQDKCFTWTERERSYRSDEEIHLSADWKQEKGLYPSVSGRDERSNCSEKSISEVHDVSDSLNQHRRQRSKHYHQSSSMKQNVSRGKCESNSGRKNLNRNLKERADDMEIVKDHKSHRHTHHDHLESRLEPESLNDFRHICKEKESSQSSRHTKTKASLTNDRLKSDRWEMVDGPDDNYGGEYYHHKRKRTH